MATRIDAYVDTSALIALADAMGLRLMDILGIPSCWSTDYHLGLTRVPLVIHQH